MTKKWFGMDEVRRELLAFLNKDLTVWEACGDDRERQLAENDIYRQGAIEFAAFLEEELDGAEESGS